MSKNILIALLVLVCAGCQVLPRAEPANEGPTIYTK
jgi:hypothetical protein